MAQPTSTARPSEGQFRLHFSNGPVDDDPVAQAWRQDLRLLRQPTEAVGASA